MNIADFKPGWRVHDVFQCAWRCVLNAFSNAVALMGLTVSVGIGLLPSTACAQGHEAMYLLDRTTGIAKLVKMDPQTGGIIATTSLGFTGVYPNGLAWDGERLLIKGNTNWFMDRLIRCHAADASAVHLSSIGAPWYMIGLELDPSTRVVRTIVRDFNTNLHYVGTIDGATGVLSLGPQIIGATNVNAMAIDSSGAVVIVQGAGFNFFSLDVSSGVATLIGNLPISSSICYDLAYDASGQLWGAVTDAQTGANSGIYRIDLSTMTATRLIWTTVPYSGIAFGNETAAQSYCVAKISSLSCVPSLRAAGIASPTAKSGFTIAAENLNNNRVGMLLCSSGGRAAIPFQGGLLCIAPPLFRSPVGPTGGTPPPALDCSGTWSIDYNELIWGKLGGTRFSGTGSVASPFSLPGNTVDCQWWGRDPGFPAPNNSMLSDGIEFVLSP